MNTFGQHFRITSFGESHGKAMGVIIDGCPAGVLFSTDLLQEHLERRRPGAFPWQTSRKESDTPQVLSGVLEDKTLGTPIAMIVENKNQKSSDYKSIKPRKGHADDLWKDKFLHSDIRGGGRASGRETVSRVMGGAVACMMIKKLHPKLNVFSYATKIGSHELTKKEIDPKALGKIDQFFPNKEKLEQVKKMLIQAKEEGQSYGGKATICIQGIPRGLGQPVFKKLKAELSQAFMSIGTVYKVSLGEGEESLSGEEFHKNSSSYSGIRGGISTGEDISMQISFKPPSSIGEIAKQGRHDPCVIPRALPVLEAMAYLVLADQILAQRLDRI